MKSFLLSLSTIVCLTIIFSCNNAPAENKHIKETPKVDVLSPEYALAEQGIGKFKDVNFGEINAAQATKGQKVFETKCSPCHKLTDEKLIGPGLKDVTKRRNLNWILNQMTNTQEMLQKDEISKKLLEEFKTPMVVAVTEDEAKQVVEYFRKQDSRK